MRILQISLLIIATAPISIKSCKRTEFKCANSECIASYKHCNSIQDCSDGSDEYANCTPCNSTYFGEIGRTFEIEVKRPDESEVPFSCHLNFTAGGGVLGELVQLSFESFAVGTFESFTSEGCPDGFISIKEGNRPSSGGKWCGSAWGYTVYYSETPSVNLTLHLDRFPQQQSSGYTFEFKLSYKFLKLSDAKIRYGNATQRSFRGKLNTGSYCDRLFEGCSRRPCRIQSPNYPGIYPRNVSCHYRVRERNVPPDKHALIAVRQAHFHHKEHLPKFDNSDRVLRIWDQCNMMQDYIEILDGWGPSATTLAHLCSGETVPEIISSGPELMVKFHTSPFGNPFHPLPLSYLPGFELEIEVFYVNKESPTYIEPGKKCEFLVTTFDSTSGLLESPLHSLPPNTTCHYHFRGNPKEIIWISFIKYHVTDFNTGECDVQLQIWDGDIKTLNTVPLIGQFCRDDKPKLCDHSLLKNSSRETRPCGLGESYVSSGADLTIAHSIRYGSVLYPVSFVLRYEFIDFSQEGAPLSRHPCDRLFTTSHTLSGRFYSPRITFLYGRGGKQDLTCDYHFEGGGDGEQRLKVTFLRANFGPKDCISVYNPEIGRWVCHIRNYQEGYAHLKIFEYPWGGVEILRDCLCANLTEPLTLVTKTARKVVVRFSVVGMRISEDYHDYNFEATFEVLSEGSCVNPWQSRRLRGSSGEISLRSLGQNHSNICLHQPWLIEPEDSLNNFIYLKIKGANKRDSRLCPGKNRILVYPAGRTEEVRVICPALHDGGGGEVVEMFSEGWDFFSPLSKRRVPLPKNSRSFIVEFLQRESRGNFAVTWMEVSKNPALTLPMLVTPPDCPHNCPELGACISEDLWCDGLRHCPSGNDEQEANCDLHRGGFPISYLNSMALSAVVLVLLTVLSVGSFYFFKHWRRGQDKNVIVSVTEHTFLEFKSGLC